MQMSYHTANTALNITFINLDFCVLKSEIVTNPNI